VEKLANYKKSYPQWPGSNLDYVFAEYPVDEAGVDLLKVRLGV
jgi:hypothetical protein